MACDRVKSNVSKWNSIGRIHFKHMKNCQMFMSCNVWVCSEWTLDVVFIVRDGTSVVWPCVVRKGAEKHVLT